ncbi:MAG: hypothetical protein KatS3mg105_4836 [Gemmatales bacterium]|nr:MAG: hypothetical protein KatS3mg105_4836 [Gemmatales bacterium]
MKIPTPAAVLCCLGWLLVGPVHAQFSYEGYISPTQSPYAPIRPQPVKADKQQVSPASGIKVSKRGLTPVPVTESVKKTPITPKLVAPKPSVPLMTPVVKKETTTKIKPVIVSVTAMAPPSPAAAANDDTPVKVEPTIECSEGLVVFSPPPCPSCPVASIPRTARRCCRPCCWRQCPVRCQSPLYYYFLPYELDADCGP